MDIKDIKAGAISISTLTQEKKKTSSATGFQKALEEAKTAISSSNQPSAVPSPAKQEEIFLDTSLSLKQIAFYPHGKEMTPAQSQGVQAAESSLNLFEKYQEALADPTRTLREIDPLLRALVEKVNANQEIIRQMSPSDPLEKILREIEILSTVESQKFNRGDYI